MGLGDDFEITTSDPDEIERRYQLLADNGYEEDDSVLTANISGEIPALDMAPRTSRENYAKRAEEELYGLKKQESKYLLGATQPSSLDKGDLFSTVFTSVLPTLLGAAIAGKKGAYAGAGAGLTGAAGAVAGLGVEKDMERKRQQILATSIADDIKAKRSEVEKQRDAGIDYQERAALQAQSLAARKIGNDKLTSALGAALGSGGRSTGSTGAAGSSGERPLTVDEALLRLGINPKEATPLQIKGVSELITKGQSAIKGELDIKKEQMGDTARSRAFIVAGYRFVPTEVSPDQAEKMPALVDAYNGALAGLDELRQFAVQSTYGGIQRTFSPDEKDHIAKIVDRVRTQLKNIQTARDQSKGTGTDEESLAARERLVPDIGSFWTELGSGVGRSLQLSASIPSQVNNAINIIQQEAADTLKGYGYTQEAVGDIPQGDGDMPPPVIGKEYPTREGMKPLKRVDSNGRWIF
jgi:hypothetical protein